MILFVLLLWASYCMLFSLAYESDEVDRVLTCSAIDSQTRPQPKRTPQRVTKMKIKYPITLSINLGPTIQWHASWTSHRKSNRGINYIWVLSMGILLRRCGGNRKRRGRRRASCSWPNEGHLHCGRKCTYEFCFLKKKRARWSRAMECNVSVNAFQVIHSSHLSYDSNKHPFYKKQSNRPTTFSNARFPLLL
jgi:hypothetical protein